MISNAFQRINLFIKKYAFFIGLCIIIIGSVLVRLPYFLYIPEPDFGGDVAEYYAVVSELTNKNAATIGYPTIGYPAFLRVCEQVSNTTWCVSFMQSLLSLIALLVFYVGYKVQFKKHLIFVAFIIFGFSSSNATLYFETGYYPDSLLLSTYIAFIGVMMLYLAFKKNSLIVFLALIAFIAISIRPSGIILLPVYILFITYVFYNKIVPIQKSIINCLSLLVFLFLLCWINYTSPLYRSFNIIPKQPVQQTSINPTAVKELYEQNSKLIEQVELLIPKSKLPRFSSINKYNTSDNLDTVFSYYRDYLMYGIYYKYHPVGDYISTNFSAQFSINLDSVIKQGDVKNIDKYYALKREFVALNDTNSANYRLSSSLKLKLANSLYFFKFFYVNEIRVDNLAYEQDRQNRDFYEWSLKSRVWSHYVYKDIGNSYLSIKTKENPFDKIYKQVIKEKDYSKTKVGDDLDEVFWKLKSSRINRWFIEPFYKIQPLLFRNMFYPIVFIIMAISSFVGLILSKFTSPLFLILFIICSLLMMTNFIHAIHFCFLYLRYTYQVSFMYYTTLLFLPIMVESFLYYKKEGVFKD